MHHTTQTTSTISNSTLLEQVSGVAVFLTDDEFSKTMEVANEFYNKGNLCFESRAFIFCMLTKYRKAGS